MTEFLNSSEKEILSYDYAKYDGIKSSLLIDKDENIYNFLYKYFVDKEIRLLRDKGISFEEVKKLEFIKTTKDVVRKLKLVASARCNSESMGSLIGALVDKEMKRLGLKGNNDEE